MRFYVEKSPFKGHAFNVFWTNEAYEEDENFTYSEADESLYAEGYDGWYLKSYMETEEYKKEKAEYEAEVARQSEIDSLKQYLTDTDYVIAKLNELKLDDEEEYEKAREEYDETLKKRKEARKRINELEGE